MSTLEYRWKKAKSQRSRNSDKITGIVLHSTDGYTAGDIEILTTGPVSVHWYITRTGDIFHFVDNSNCAYHVGRVADPEWNNDHTLGIELGHIDGNEKWPTIQVAALGALIAYLRQRYGDLPIKSHAEVAYPQGRKQDPLNFPWPKLHEAYEIANKKQWEAKAI